MLWRANLYIKETNDWNDNNSWNAPPTTPDGNNSGKPSTTEGFYSEFGFLKADKTSDISETKWYGKNEWNKSYDGKTRLKNSANGALINEPTEVNYLRNLTDGDGTQVVSFNKFVYNPLISATIESNTVAYSYGCADSPFEFNDEMRQQQLLLADYYNRDGVKFVVPKGSWPENLDSIDDFTIQQYTTNISAIYSGEITDTSIKVDPTKCITLEGWSKTITPTEIWTSSNSTYIKPSIFWDEVEFDGEHDGSTIIGKDKDNNSYWIIINGSEWNLIVLSKWGACLENFTIPVVWYRHKPCVNQNGDLFFMIYGDEVTETIDIYSLSKESREKQRVAFQDSIN